MHQEQLNAIKERATKATPGPWRYNKKYEYLAPVIPQQNVAVICNEIYWQGNEEFIENAREDVPALVAEVERLREALEDIASTGFTFQEMLEIAREALDGETNEH